MEEADGQYQPSSRELTGELLQGASGEQQAGYGTIRPSTGIPDIEDLIALNRAIHADAGQPERHSLVERSALQSVIDRATEVYGSSNEDKIHAAAVLAHGIAAIQAFRDGNRRTAYWAVRMFLTANSLGYLSGDNDHMLVRRLNQLVERSSTMRSAPSLESFQALFARRLAKRKRPCQHIIVTKAPSDNCQQVRLSRSTAKRSSAETCGCPRKKNGQPCKRRGNCPYHKAF